MESPIEQIKNKLDILEVVRGYIRLEKTGINLRASCPFHKEKTPSFFVSPTRQTWKCFGCNRGGDMFTFVQEIEGVEFVDALRLLADKAGVTLKKHDAMLKTERSRALEILEHATRFFEKQLQESSRGKEAFEYLGKRGLRPETTKAFRLGWAPNAQVALFNYLRDQGYAEQEIQKTGLIVRSGRDRFRGRIIFPLFDTHGKTLGFTGRIFGRDERDGDPKYLNSPQTAVFDKGKILYGLHRAKITARKEGFVVLVEGQMDLLLSHQAGIVNTIATSGTALTPWQLQVLRRHVDTLVTAFDQDSAGEQATQRGIDLALEEGFAVRVVMIEGGKDPADIILQDPEQWTAGITQNQRSILDFYFSLAFEKNDPTLPEGKRRISDTLLPVLKRVGHAIEQAHWVSELARRLKLKEEQVWEALKKQDQPARGTPSRLSSDRAVSAPEERSRRELLEEEILLFLLGGEEAPRISGDVQGLILHWTTASGARLLEYLLGASGEERVLPDEIRPLFDELSLKKEAFVHKEDDIPQQLELAVKELRALILREELSRIGQEIEDAESKGDQERTAQLLEEFHSRSRKLSDLLHPAPAVS